MPQGNTRQDARSPFMRPPAPGAQSYMQGGRLNQELRSPNGQARRSAWQQQGNGGRGRLPPVGRGFYGPPAGPPGSRGAVGSSAGQPRVHPWKNAGFIVRLVILIMLLCLVAPSVYGFGAYQSTIDSATDGMNQLKAVESVINDKNASLFSPQTLSTLQQHLSAAERDFGQIQDQLNSAGVLLSVGETVPVAGGKIADYVRLARVAYDLSAAGNMMISAFSPIIQSLHGALGDPSGTKSLALTAAELGNARSTVQQVRGLIDDAASQESGISLAALGASQATVARELSLLNQSLPKIQSLIDGIDPLMAALPTLLGVNAPASYLVLAVDTAELRPIGGFAGNYGVLTVTGGHLQPSFKLENVYELDCPGLTFNADGSHNGTCPTRAVPSQFSWFTLTWDGVHPSWGLRDAGLSPDYPTSARIAEGLYALESGQHVDGVITITPAVISSLIKVIGDLSVPYNGDVVTVTPQNLEQLIHYYQSNYALGQNGNQKAFTSAVSQALMDKLHHLPAGGFSALLQVAWNALKTKDIQVYVNDQGAEQWLIQNHIAGAVERPQGDSLEVVDTNMAGDKTNLDVTEQITDQITLDQQGGATHHLTLFYNFPGDSFLYGQDNGYIDYIRIYAPPQAEFKPGGSGCTPHQSQDLGHTVWACEINMPTAPASGTIKLIYYVPNVAQNVQGQEQYSLLLQKQAGTANTVDISITPPAGASSVSASAPLKLKTGSGPAQFDGVLNQDVSLWVRY